MPYAHCDNAWGHTRRWHEDRYTLIFNEVLDIMKKDPDYKWFMDTEYEQLSPFARRCPERIPELKKRIKEGRIEVAPTVISNLAADAVGGETFIRNMVYGKRYFESVLGATSQVHTVIDLMPGHSQIPQLIKKGGYNYFRFTRPGNNDLVDFFWKGLDGTVVLASRGGYGYGALADSLAFPHDFKTNWEKAADVIYGEIDRRCIWLYKKGKVSREIEITRSSLGNAGIVWFPRGGDDVRPLRDGAGRPVDLPGLVKEWNKKEDVPMIYGTPTEYFAELEKFKDKLPVLSGVLESSGCAARYGTLGNNSLLLWWLKDEIAITAAERLSCVSNLVLGGAYPSETIDKLWHDLFTTTGHAIRLAFTNDYDRLLAKEKRVAKRATAIAQSAHVAMASKIRHTQAGIPVIVFNQQAWDRTDLASAEVEFKIGAAAGMTLKDGKGRTIPYQVSREQRYKDGSVKHLAFEFIADVPSLGYATYYAETGADKTFQSNATDTKPAAKIKISNAFCDVVFDGGNMKSVVLKKDRIKLFNSGKTINAVSYSTLEGNDSFDTAGPFLEEIEESGVELTAVERGPVYSKVISQGRIGKHEIRKETLIYSDIPRIDCSVEIRAKGGDGVFKAKFPFAFNGKIMAHVPFGTEERNRAKEVCGANFLSENYPQTFSAERWIDFSCREFGVAVISPPGQRGFDYDQENNVAKHIILKNRTMPNGTCWKNISGYHEAKGIHTLRYAFYPHTGNWKKAHVHRRAVEFQEPLMCVSVKAATGHRASRTAGMAGAAGTQLPQENSLLGIKPDSIVMTGFYKYGDSVVLRVYESHGKSNKAKITLPFAVEKASETDFYGDPLNGDSASGKPSKSGQKITVNERMLTFEMKPWEIVTLFIRPKQ